jgi:hypothetical protein
MALLDSLGATLGLAQLLIQFQGPPHPFEQHDPLNRFFQEIHGAGLQGLHGQRDIAVPGQKDDRNGEAARPQRRLNFKATHAGHGYVQQQTARAVFRIGRQESAAVGMAFDLQAGRLQQLGQGVPNCCIVVDYEYCLAHGRGNKMDDAAGAWAHPQPASATMGCNRYAAPPQSIFLAAG